MRLLEKEKLDNPIKDFVKELNKIKLNFVSFLLNFIFELTVKLFMCENIR